MIAKLESNGVNVQGLSFEAKNGGPVINLGTGLDGGKANNANDENLALVALLPEVERVYLFKGKFTSVGLVKLAALPKLRSLDIYAPDVEPTAFSALKEFKRLESLNLNDYPVTDEILGYAAANRSLKQLNITRPQAISSAAFLKFLDSLDSLESLILQSETIDNACLERLGKMKNMTLLWTSSTKITPDAWATLARLTKMTDLNLIGSSLDDNGARAIAGMTNLRNLILNKTRITDAGLASFAGLTKLHDLGLDDTAITDDGMVHLKGMTELENLYVGNTKVTIKGLAFVPRKDRMGMMRTGQGSLSSKQFAEVFTMFPETQIFDPTGYWRPERIKAAMKELGKELPQPSK